MNKALPVERATFHITDANQYRSCRVRWHFGSHLRMNLEPIAPPRALWLGIGVHEALRHYYGEGADIVDAFLSWSRTTVAEIKSNFPEGLDEEREQQFVEDEELGVGMVAHYRTWSKSVDDFKVVDVEEGVNIPGFIKFEKPIQVTDEYGVRLANSVPLEGRGDMLVQSNADGRYWVYEHKTAISIDTDRLILEEQPGVYQYAMSKKHGVEIAGVMFNFLRKKIPAVPQTLKAGGLSQRANIDTTYEVYCSTLSQHMLDPEPYQEILASLEAQGNTFFLREAVVRSSNELGRLIPWLQDIGREMFDDPKIYPSPEPMKCRMCPFQAPCISLHDGSDYKFQLKMRYQSRKKEKEVVGSGVQSPETAL